MNATGEWCYDMSKAPHEENLLLWSDEMACIGGWSNLLGGWSEFDGSSLDPIAWAKINPPTEAEP